MPRKNIPSSSTDPYHVCARCLNQEWFELDLKDIWTIMENYLNFIQHAFDLQIYSFVLMANHFHLLLRASNGNLSEAMNYFMRETSREINRQTGRINQVWGQRYHKTLIPNYHYFMNTYKYIYQNPLRAGICNYAEEYPYSTLSVLCGIRKSIIPLCEDTILFTPHFDTSALEWLNQRPSFIDEEQMRWALRRNKFTYSADPENGYKSRLEEFLL